MVMRNELSPQRIQKRIIKLQTSCFCFTAVFSLGLLLAACSQKATSSPTVLPSPQISTTSAPTPTQVPSEAPTAAAPAFVPATYRDDGAGFELEYPSSWTADAPQAGGDRGYFAQITSWSRVPGELPEFVPEGETILSITVLQWDPKNALDEFIATRKQGWEASGFEILQEEEWTLKEDWKAVKFVIQSPEEPAFYLITTIGNRYLVLSGTGDLDILSEIGGTLRLIESLQ
jgi:hypothetical protein